MISSQIARIVCTIYFTRISSSHLQVTFQSFVAAYINAEKPMDLAKSPLGGHYYRAVHEG